MRNDLKAIKGYAHYFVTAEGEVFSNYSGELRELTIFKNPDGYSMVKLYGEVTKTFTVHKLVAEAFIGYPLQGQLLHHIDGNKSNNSVSNLIYIYLKDNINIFWDSEATDDHKKENADNMRKYAAARRIFSSSDILLIRQLQSNGMSMNQIAKMYHVNPRTILRVINGESYKDV